MASAGATTSTLNSTATGPGEWQVERRMSAKHRMSAIGDSLLDWFVSMLSVPFGHMDSSGATECGALSITFTG